MEYIYGALLLHSAGKEIDEENLKKVLVGAGVPADDARLKSLLESMKEVNIEEVLKNAAAPVAAAPAKEEKKAEKKAEKKEEKKEESDSDAMAGLSSLFG
ncbi:MAG: 50S ribosomal protein P1 [Ferroplasma sp.]